MKEWWAREIYSSKRREYMSPVPTRWNMMNVENSAAGIQNYTNPMWKLCQSRCPNTCLVCSLACEHVQPVIQEPPHRISGDLLPSWHNLQVYQRDPFKSRVEILRPWMTESSNLWLEVIFFPLWLINKYLLCSSLLWEMQNKPKNSFLQPCW